MLVNNMESLCKIFFRGVQTRKVKYDQELAEEFQPKLESSLTVLNQKNIIKTRARYDTNVRQFHAGQLFDYLQDNINLK